MSAAEAPLPEWGPGEKAHLDQMSASFRALGYKARDYAVCAQVARGLVSTYASLPEGSCLSKDQLVMFSRIAAELYETWANEAGS